jgi:hypothetical protein
MTTDRAERPDTSAPEFDPDALRDEYRQERDKRIRADGNEQYREVVGDFAHYVEDPYVDPIVRDPISDDVDAVVVGGELLAEASSWAGPVTRGRRGSGGAEDRDRFVVAVALEVEAETLAGAKRTGLGRGEE